MKLDPASSPVCPQSENIPALLAGELAPVDSVKLKQHVAGCGDCQQIAKSLQRVMRQLRSVPSVEASAAFTQRVLHAVHEPEILRPRFGSLGRWVAAAAAVVVGLLVAGKYFPRQQETLVAQQAEAVPESTATSLNKALDWFCKAQEPDGSWSATRWGGDERFEVALTALPLMALLSADVEMTPDRAAVIARAKARLEGFRATNGAFGRRFSGAAYNQAIGTLALLQAYQREPDASARMALTNSLAVIVSQQTPEGWWGASNAVQPNLAATLWQLEALKTAVALGWKEFRPHLERGEKWVGSSAVAQTVDFPARESGQRLDFFDAYFATTKLRAASDEASQQRLASIRHRLLEQQISHGEDTGTWTPDSRWGQVGGRIYATALASLTLR